MLYPLRRGSGLNRLYSRSQDIRIMTTQITMADEVTRVRTVHTARQSPLTCVAVP